MVQRWNEPNIVIDKVVNKYAARQAKRAKRARVESVDDILMLRNEAARLEGKRTNMTFLEQELLARTRVKESP